MHDFLPFLIRFAPSLGPLFGAVCGALLAMLSGHLRDVSAQKLQQQRLDHEATQRVIERHSAMRRDLYLAALAGISSMKQAVLSLLDPDTDTQRVAEAEKASSTAISAVYVIAPPDAIRSVASYLSKLQRIKVDLVFSRTESVDAKQIYAHSLQMQRDAITYRGELYRQRTDLIAAGDNTNAADFQTIESKIVAATSTIDFYSLETVKWLEIARQAMLPLFELVMAQQEDLDKAGQAALLAIRAELGITTDDVAFREMYSEIADQNKQFGKEIIRKLGDLGEQRASA